MSDKLSDKFAIRDKQNGSYYPRMKLVDIIEEINRDRSQGWVDYDETDWREGLENFTQWEVIEDGKD